MEAQYHFNKVIPMLVEPIVVAHHMQLTSPNPWRKITADFEPQLWAVVDIAAVVRYVANAADITLCVIESID